MVYDSMHDLRVDLNPKGGGIFTDLRGEITDLVGSYTGNLLLAFLSSISKSAKRTSSLNYAGAIVGTKSRSDDSRGGKIFFLLYN